MSRPPPPSVPDPSPPPSTSASVAGPPPLPSRTAPLSPVEGEPDPDGADCVGCGRCCHHGARTVHLLEADEARMGKRLLELYTELDERPPWMRFVRNGGDRCGGLDVSVEGQYPCAIYAWRPEDCRIVEPGSPACLEARRLGHLGSSVVFQRARAGEGG